MTHYTATYSPDDNKLRLYASSRLDAETYTQVKAAGFRWAPKQELFVAPMWTPSREDLLISLAGSVDDEDKSLVQRAEERAERFETYSDNRAADADSARKAVAAIADNIPFGQPILVGHHSEKHARRDAAKIENGMRKAVKMWEQSSYWTDRAAGALHAAKYKERPDVRARRIKGIQSELRKLEKMNKQGIAFLAGWTSIKDEANNAHEIAKSIANYSHISRSFPLADFPRDPPASQYEGPMGLWSALDGNVITWQQARAISIEVHTKSAAARVRWITHYENRLAYELAMLEEAGATDLLKPKPRATLMPMLNYRAPGGNITTENKWNRGTSITYAQVEMTKAEYAAINKDYRGARLGVDRAHRFRTAMIKHNLVCVFLTDSKEHPAPKQEAPPAHPAASIPERGYSAFKPKAADPRDEQFSAMKQSLKSGGVKVVIANQLFPTPTDLAERMVKMAGVEPGQRVLEPSAGTGRIIDALDAVPGANVVAVELSVTLADNLRLRSNTKHEIRCADFLELNGELGTFDRIVMNPPFENGSDIKHIKHAAGMLKPGGRLVAICVNGPRQREQLEPLADLWEDLPEETFKQAGTGVRTALLVIEA